MRTFLPLIGGLLVLLPLRADSPPTPNAKPPEWLEMLVSIVSGGDMSNGSGWFHSGSTRYTWERFSKRFDVNRDGRVTRDEFKGKKEFFTRLDRDSDGEIAKNDFDWSDDSPFMQQFGFARQLLRRNDRNQDGRLTETEWAEIFKQLSPDGRPIDAEKVRQLLYPPRPAIPAKSASSADPSMWTLLKGLWRSEIGSVCEGPELEAIAPNFKLETVDGKQKIELKSLIGKKPIVLVFGNYTCGPYRITYGSVEDIRKRYAEEVEFVSVYVREAHPTDGWRMTFNDRSGVVLPQPRTKSERVKVATECFSTLKMTMPLLVDDLDDHVGNLYSGMPSRLYLIDRDGKVAYKSGRGPFGFKPAELEQAILIHLLEASLPMKEKSSFRIPSNDEAWKRLPETGQGGNQPLPVWVRMLSQSLPRTAAVMLELDFAQRTQSSLDPKWRATVRYRIAQIHNCEYSQREALADFRRHGGRIAIDDFPHSLKAEEASRLQATIAFAEQLTRDGAKLTDEQVAYLLKELGKERLTALVHLTAFANFQDRLLLSLGLADSVEPPLEPLNVRFQRPWMGGDAPPRMLPPDRPQNLPDIAINWKGVTFETLQKNLEDQRCRLGRISVPPFEDVKKRLPAWYPAPTKPNRVRWSLVSLGYAPELAANWLMGLRTFGEESKQDRVFEELVFWVITREISCFY